MSRRPFNPQMSNLSTLRCPNWSPGRPLNPAPPSPLLKCLQFCTSDAHAKTWGSPQTPLFLSHSTSNSFGSLAGLIFQDSHFLLSTSIFSQYFPSSNTFLLLLFYVSGLVCLPEMECRKFCPFGLLVSPLSLEQLLAHSRCSINVC